MGSFQNRQPQRPIATEDGPPVSYVNELQGAPWPGSGWRRIQCAACSAFCRHGGGFDAGRFLCAPRQCHRNMAGAAQQPVILEPALSAAVGDGDDVIRLPSRTDGAPRASRRTITRRRLRSRPLAMCLHHVEAADPAGALVALLDLLADVRRTAANLPFVHARVAAERPPRRRDPAATPPANRLACLVAIRLAPLLRCHHMRPEGAHAGKYRGQRGRAVGG
jgi:hypothetical protein